ncbi:MAG TPA: diaminopimelate decarboxylase [Candidatus Sulfotelmatobacter sp.]|jgi:diaminopimelate decarboxylase/aspartate kinase|nr:diaminopimelate decarboxylase [Candidatus Sulfotelmatobacter sp.]
MIVCKFGGTSVADAAALRRLVGIVQARLDEAPLVVVSALSKISDELIALVREATQRGESCEARLGALAERHRALLEACGSSEAAGTVRADLERDFEAIASQLKGITLLGEASASIRARVVGMGERMSSRIVAAWFRAAGTECLEIDASEVVRTVGLDPERDPPDLEAIRVAASGRIAPRLSPGRVLLTQGFIATDPNGRPSLLGRGGSDYSASLLGSALRASRIEIWTDVDGVLTANPSIVPQARRVKVLSFDEASELAYFGAKVLHPSTLLPAVDAAIPVRVLNARRPDGEGTTILREGIRPADDRFVVKAIADKRAITVVEVTSTRMLMAHGFLARVFEVFDRHRTPVDLVATSEVSVSVTIDDERAVEAIAYDLGAFARVEVERGMAVVCLVGEGMRGRSAVVAEVFRALRDRPVRMFTKGASAINVSLVVDTEDVVAVVAGLHEAFFSGSLPAEVFGEAHDEAARSGPSSSRAPAGLAAIAEKNGTPCYVYDLSVVSARAERVRAAFGSVAGRVYYACKANANRAVLERIVSAGIGIEATSPGEVARALEAGCSPERILFSAANARTAEIVAVLRRGGMVTLSARSEIARVGREAAGASVLLRVNVGAGAGHHRHVVTAGAHSKFGIPIEEIPRALEDALAAGLRVAGVHSHIGSGVVDSEPLIANLEALLQLAEAHPELSILDIGGGFGISYRDDEAELDVERLAERVRERLASFRARAGGSAPEIWIEPGRYLVAPAAWLLARVTCRKESGGLVFVGVDTGMNHLLRPALYGAYHRIENLTGPGRPIEWVEVVGNVCESADTFASGRALPRAEEGDLLAFCDAGAYGFVMASEYNLRPLPQEIAMERIP